MGQWQAHYDAKAVQETWGHLAPEENKTYEGFIVFCIGSDGTICPIDYDFVGLDGSPWLYDAIVDFIGDNSKEHCRVYRFDGTFCNYVFAGSVSEISVARKQ